MTHIIHHTKTRPLPSPRAIRTLIIIGMIAFTACAVLAAIRVNEAAQVQAMEDRT